MPKFKIGDKVTDNFTDSVGRVVGMTENPDEPVMYLVKGEDPMGGRFFEWCEEERLYPFSLTEKQVRRVLTWLRKGYEPSVIAWHMGLTAGTVRAVMDGRVDECQNAD